MHKDVKKYFLFVKFSLITTAIICTLTCAGQVDTSTYTIISYTNTILPLLKKSTATQLSQNDIIELEIILKQSVDSFNLKQNGDNRKSSKNKLIDLKDYKRQFVASVNDAGEKEVWVNCFCRNAGDSDWRKGIVLVDDGGKCYFHLTINLTTKKHYEFMVNGPR